jgi:hypothetical protein
MLCENIMKQQETTTIDQEYLTNKESWVTSRWRPMMAWAYLVIILFDFLIGPIFYAWFAWYTDNLTNYGEWKPLTIQGGGVFHIAMGAILGIAAYSRGREKLTAMEVFGSELHDDRTSRNTTRSSRDSAREPDRETTRERNTQRGENPD